MRVLITGGTGFIGLSLAESLLAQGHSVRILAPEAPNALMHDPALARATLICGDIRDPDALTLALKDVQAVVHLAAITPDARQEVTDPARIVDVNVTGTANLMHAVALYAPRARTLVVSSVAVYGTGTPLNQQWDEESDLPSPASLYGITKQAAEQVAGVLARINGTNLTIVRLGPVYGPWEHDSGVRPLLSPQAQALALALSGQEILLPRSLFADWLYSRDAGHVLTMLLLTERTMPALLNLGAGRVFSVADWCKAAASYLPSLRWRLASPEEKANVHMTLHYDRAPLAIDRLRTFLPGGPSRPLVDCVEDHLSWARPHLTHFYRTGETCDR